LHDAHDEENKCHNWQAFGQEAHGLSVSLNLLPSVGNGMVKCGCQIIHGLSVAELPDVTQFQFSAEIFPSRPWRNA
jgi:hypothetical protein